MGWEDSPLQMTLSVLRDREALEIWHCLVIHGWDTVAWSSSVVICVCF